MSDGNKKILVFVGPPLAVVSFLLAFWVAGQILGPTATAGGSDTASVEASVPETNARADAVDRTMSNLDLSAARADREKNRSRASKPDLRADIYCRRLMT